MAGKTRYIGSVGELKRKDNSIVFKNEKGNNYIPIEGIRELYCLNEVTLNTKLLDFLSRYGVILHFFNYYGNYSGTYYPKDYLLSGKLTVKQALTYSDTNIRLEIAKAFVEGIRANIYEVLYHYYRHDKNEIKEYLDWSKQIAVEQLGWAENIKQVLAVEGEIWQRFYAQFKYFIHEDFILNKRVKRPPDNPINAMISFGNTLLYTKTLTEIYHTHLDPTISFLHQPSERRFSLALDISEPFKPILVYSTLFDLVNRKKIQVSKHFVRETNYCILNETGRNIFIKAFEERLGTTFNHPTLRRKVSYQSAIKLDCYKLIKTILEGKEFITFSKKRLK